MSRRRLVVEADGGSRGNPGVAGFGALVVDAGTRTLLAERAAPLGRASNNVAEYSGLIAGLQAADDIDPAADVEVRMDSKLVVEQMSGRWKIKHDDMRRLAGQARQLVTERADLGGTVTFTWIPRERNKAADKLSNEGMDGHRVDRRHERDGATDPVAVEGDDPAPEAPAASGSPDVGPPVRIVLVRHGVTELTPTGLLDGRGGPDAPLTVEGRRQAVAAADGLRAFLGEVPARLVTSSLSRARQSGAVMAGELDVEPEIDAAWDEQDFGDWEGRTTAQVLAEDPQAYRNLRLDESYARPGGESRMQLRDRVLAAFRSLAEDARQDERAVVVVSHRAALLALLGECLQMTAAGAWSLALSPGSLTSIKTWRDGGVLVEFVNDTSHLR